jgi:hypothetical protein
MFRKAPRLTQLFFIFLETFFSSIRITIKNKNMRTLIVGKPCSPSIKISDEVIEMKRILITYGGGMGGGNKTYYTKEIKKEQAINGGWYIETIDGKKIQLMPNFVVEVEQTKILKLVTDVTLHRNFSKKVCKKAVLTEYFDLSGFDDYNIDVNYSSRDDKIIFKEEELE